MMTKYKRVSELIHPQSSYDHEISITVLWTHISLIKFMLLSYELKETNLPNSSLLFYIKYLNNESMSDWFPRADRLKLSPIRM